MAVTFLKGAASHKAVEKAEAEAEAKQNIDYTYTTRFWLPPNGETKITFLDGDLNEDGMLDELTYWEHQVKMGGSWRNWFPCIQGDENCPICESGEKNSLVAIFTIIDHTEWTSKKGKNAGKTYKDQRKLFVCKKGVLKRLRMLAKNRGGLSGATFDVARLGDKSENVGDTFDFSKKWDDMEEFRNAFNLKAEDIIPADYAAIVPNQTRDQLVKLGFGTGVTPIGAEAATEDEYGSSL